MSDSSQGPGWWQASDGRWYPPQPANLAPTPPPANKSNKGCLTALAIVGVLAVLGIIAVVVLIAVAADEAEEAVDRVRVSEEGVRSFSGNETNPPAEDVVVTECATDELGYMVARGTVTNHSSEASDYFIEVAFESEDEATQLATGNASLSSIGPGQDAPLEANSFTEAPGELLSCRVTEVNRFASN